MHQYSTQQLAKFIPRPFKHWTKQDVVTWITLNQVDVDAHLFQQGDLDGAKLLTIHPDQLVSGYGLTRFIAKQMVEWVEEESNEFDQYVLEDCQKHQEHKEEPSSSLEEEQQTPEQVKEEFRINDLEENGVQAKFKSEEINDVTERVEISKWGKKAQRKENQPKLSAYLPDKPKSHNAVINFKNPYVKFASSEFISVESSRTSKLAEKTLRLISSKESFNIPQHCKIGRFKDNQICISDESVSRWHAEINCLATSKGDFKYYIKDLKSKYGTFIGCKTAQTNIEGCSFLLEESEISIIKIELLKPSPTNRQRTFDITLKVEDVQVKITNKSTITIGNKKSADVKCDTGTAKIWLDKQRKVCCMEAVEGRLYKKLKELEQWDLQAQMDGGKKVDLCFGTYKCTVQTFYFCVSCGRVSDQCQC